MTLVDWIIVVFALLLAVLGAQQGFVVGALSLLGFAAGAFAGSRLGPLILSGGNRSPYAPIVSLAGALLIGGVAATGLEGAGRSLRRVVLRGPLGRVDGLLGALLSAGVALGIAWIAGAVALQTPGQPELRRAVQRSAVLRTLNDLLPPSGSILNALARIDPLPALRGPSADVAAPRAAIARDPQVRAAAASVVRVLGSACGLGVEGSGWVAEAGGVRYVVTNAHVVAGQSDTVVQREGTGPKLAAHAVVYDVTNDVAILRVDGLDAPALPLGDDPKPGTSGALLGFPANGPYDVRAARLGATRSAISSDAYGRSPVTRRLTTLRGVVRHGNSGGPVVDGEGRVATTVFAATVGGPHRGGYGVPDRVVRSALDTAGTAAVSTGPCAR